MRVELSAAKKEAETYIARAEASKAIRKREDWSALGEGDDVDATAEPSAGRKKSRAAGEEVANPLEYVRRTFVQRQPLPDALAARLGGSSAEAAPAAAPVQKKRPSTREHV